MGGSGGGIVGGGGGGGGQGDNCPRLMFVVLADADPSVVSVGDGLAVTLLGEAVAVLSASDGSTIGTISPAPGVARLRECLERGVGYEGLVESVEAGVVRVQVTRA